MDQHTAHPHPPLTVADPALGRVLGGKQLELGLQGPGLHAGAVQPLQHLREHFEEQRREASVLGHAALWDDTAHSHAAQAPRLRRDVVTAVNSAPR